MKELVFGLDIGTTSIGFAAIDYDKDSGTGKIRRLGTRIFPEARDPDGAPWNQERRAARLRRRQLRRRRKRRRDLSDKLHQAGLLPDRKSPDWDKVMKCNPYDLRRRAFEGEDLSPHEIGRAIYHLAQRRHFRGRDIDDISDEAKDDKKTDADEKKAKSDRYETVQDLKASGKTLGAWLAERDKDHERKRARKRGEHVTRQIVEDEFNEICKRLPPQVRDSLHETIFFQRPTFWRLNTLGQCRFMPGAALCPKGAWLSQQRRMLEKLNNLAIASGNQRPLDKEERAAILAKLQTQESMKWADVRKAIGAEKTVKFNLQEGGERTLLGNPLEAELAKIFGKDWQDHPHKQEIRDAIHKRLWEADYGKIGEQRVVILSAAKRKELRADAVQSFITDFRVNQEQAQALGKIKLPTGWEPYSTEALQKILLKLEEGERFGAIINGPDWEAWRAETFPKGDQPTGEFVDRLPSPANKEERDHIRSLRNPTVARTRNELRKVVNNLINMFGKPDRIRIELARDIGLSKRQREEKSIGIRRQEGRRRKARADLEEKGILEPLPRDVEKWMLWEECGHRCPYTGDHISFNDLFRTGKFQVEHIWPRSRSFDDSFRNQTLCRRDYNIRKGNRTPFEAFGETDEWAAMVRRVDGMKAPIKGGVAMTLGKIKRFKKAEAMPEDFTDRQLNDTGYAAREAVAYLKKLWPDLGQDGPVKVEAVTGKVTARLRKLWGLNKILADDGEKTRADHRHHAVDALVVACCHQGMTQKLSRYWQDKDNPRAPEPHLPPPWETIRRDAEKAVKDIVVSHRVRKKVSGPLHKETIYGDTREEETSKSGPTYRFFVTRKPVGALTKPKLERIRDEAVREIVKAWIDRHGGDPKKAFANGYPKRGRKGPEIRKVRLLVKQQKNLMTKAATGYADKGNNHHIAIYRLPDGRADYDVVSLFEASERLARREPVVKRDRGDGSQFVMSLSQGDAVTFTEIDPKEIWIVKELKANGQVFFRLHKDGDPKSKLPSHKASTFLEKGAKKRSIDPIGRVRPAND